MELLTDTAASANWMVASLLGALDGGFLKTDEQAAKIVDSVIINSIRKIRFFMLGSSWMML
tara:strand:- start:168925 stop:169107 length:183 start_codon:yes stop_codon:yes gene_type:complete